MAWGRIDDNLWAHPKTQDAGLAAMGLWITALSWCMQYLTDGHIGSKNVRVLGGKPAQVKSLLESGFWRKCDTHQGCYKFHDWEKYHPTKAQILREREAEAERKRAWRESQQKANVPPGQTA